MNCKRHECVTVGPIGTRRMKKGPTGTRCMEIWSSGDFYDELQASRMSNCRSHKVHIGWRKDRAETFMTNCKRHEWVTTGPTGTRRMEMSPIGTRLMEKGSSRDFYNDLQASWMSNYRSHRYTSDGESTVWRSMMKPFITDRILFIIDVLLVQWRSPVRHSFKGDHHRWVTRVICNETLCFSMTFFLWWCLILS